MTAPALIRRYPRKVLVCGGRDYNDATHVGMVLDELRPNFIMQGGAPGADQAAARWAISKTPMVPFATYPADWEKHGNAAGPIRNQQMLDEGKPDLVVAFPGGRGTADMVRRAVAAGVPVLRPPKRPGGPTIIGESLLDQWRRGIGPDLLRIRAGRR